MKQKRKPIKTIADIGSNIHVASTSTSVRLESSTNAYVGVELVAPPGSDYGALLTFAERLAEAYNMDWLDRE